ncbi:protein POLLENLESS 3-LIKE 2 [Nymphaea colorata]|nr:protein POLLENLESS 3-LIKE 2 [Nymphaea colorata]
MALPLRPSKSAPCSPIKPLPAIRNPHVRLDSFHVIHKVPVGDTPYVKAKHVQLVDKDPDRSIALFWAAINAGDRVDSALKDMAIVMKQQNRAEEAIEAIKSLRCKCSESAQESLDNILLDLYKRCGRLDDQITLLRHKLVLIQQGMAFNGKRTKTARSQGKKFQVSIEQETTRLLGNLGWALMQQNNYVEAEAAYRKALSIAPDNNKMCNLGICLMKQGRISEAKLTLKRVKPAVADGPRGVDSHLKAYERAQEMLGDLESMNGQGQLHEMSSSVWQPQPCTQFYADENFNSINMDSNAFPPLQKSTKPILSQNILNIDAPPFYSSKPINVLSERTVHDPLANLKRTRSISTYQDLEGLKKTGMDQFEERSIKTSFLAEPAEDGDNIIWPDNKEFEEAIMAAAAFIISDTANPADCQRKIPKRLKVFQEIALPLSPQCPN